MAEKFNSQDVMAMAGLIERLQTDLDKAAHRADRFGRELTDLTNVHERFLHDYQDLQGKWAGVLLRLETAERERDEARGVCAEAYQMLAIVGNLHKSILPMLDNLSAVANGQKPPHETCLPYFAPADNLTPDRETIRELGREAPDRLNEGETLAIRDLDGSEKWYRVVKVTSSGSSGQELTLEPLDKGEGG